MAALKGKGRTHKARNTQACEERGEDENARVLIKAYWGVPAGEIFMPVTPRLRSPSTNVLPLLWSENIADNRNVSVGMMVL